MENHKRKVSDLLEQSKQNRKAILVHYHGKRDILPKQEQAFLWKTEIVCCGEIGT